MKFKYRSFKCFFVGRWYTLKRLKYGIIDFGAISLFFKPFKRPLNILRQDMKKLRLLLFKDCNRSCAGCCNQYWDLDSLEICNSFKEYDVIMLTGGEPMLKPDLVRKVIKNIREENSKCKIYMYTAKTNSNEIYEILKLLDGICVTFHDQSDVHDFVFLDYMTSNTTDKSLRLNVFEGIDITKLYLDRWKVRTNIVWDTECPLPENEVLMRLES